MKKNAPPLIKITMVLQRIYTFRVILCTAETKTSNNIITFRLKKYENILRIFHLCAFRFFFFDFVLLASSGNVTIEFFFNFRLIRRRAHPLLGTNIFHFNERSKQNQI